MAKQYYVPEGGIVKNGSDYRVNVTYTAASGKEYPIIGTLKGADLPEGASEEAKVKAHLEAICAEKEAYDVALPDPEAAPVTLLDDTTVAIGVKAVK